MNTHADFLVGQSYGCLNNEMHQFHTQKKRRRKAPLKVGKQTKKLLISSQVNESQFLFDEASWLQE